MAKSGKPHAPPGFHKGSMPPRGIRDARNATAFENDDLFDAIKKMQTSSEKSDVPKDKLKDSESHPPLRER